MSLLQRLVEADIGPTGSDGNQGDGSAPRFFATRHFLWELSLDSHGRPIGDGLAPVRDPADSKGRRGVPHQAPNLKRSSGISPLLGADDLQYVLGWCDEKSKPKRVQACLDAFVAAVEDWAARSPNEEAACAVAEFYRSGRHMEIPRQERWSSKDPVFISVESVPVTTLPSLQEAWAAQAMERKGGGEGSSEAHCLVCGERRRSLNRLPHGLPKALVPGASQEVAMLSVNLPIFGHTFNEGLTASPICAQCGETMVTALRTMAERSGGRPVGATRRYGTLYHTGQRTRIVWWTVGRNFDFEGTLRSAKAGVIADLYERVRQGSGAPRRELGTDRFCAVTFSGSTARLAINGWIDRPLDDIEANLAHWFDDHAVRPVGDSQPPYVGLYPLFLALGRWEGGRKNDGQRGGRYSTPPQGNDPHRPPDAQTHLVEAALLGRPLPGAMLHHLINRIRTDSRLDQWRAALLRLFLSRQPQRTSSQTPRTNVENSVPEPGLDETYDDPAYLAGRIMAVLGRIQYTAARTSTANRESSKPESSGLNTTFEDRYLAGAIANPQVAIVQGHRQAPAWLRKIRRTRQGAAVALEQQLNGLFSRYIAQEGVPGRVDTPAQARFLLGYHQQRSEDIRIARKKKAENSPDDIGDTPDIDPTDGPDENDE